MATGDGSIRFSSPVGRWVIFTTVLGSGIAFLDSTVVNVALVAIGEEFDASIGGLQWTVEAYLLTLGSLILLGGALGDLYGRRRIFVYGLILFTIASALCGLAPSVEFLIAARALQGIGAALLVPGSLSIIQSSFHPDDRGRAIGAWSGLAGVSTALGPFVGGWLIDTVSWRLVFYINIPLAIAAILIALRHVPETRNTEARTPDMAGSLAAIVGLGGVIYALVEGPAIGFAEPRVVVAAAIGVLALISFFYIETHVRHPMMPLSMFSSAQFSATNATTLVVYFALGGAMFLVILQLQRVLGYAALEAGLAFMPVTVLLLLLSSRTGALAQRIGPRLPLTVGPVVAGLGLLLMVRIEPGATYVSAVLPAAIVFGLGMAITVAPLTTAVLAAVETQRAGIASGVNNAVARIAGLLAVALLPFFGGITGAGGLDPETFSTGFQQAVVIAGVLCMLGGAISFFGIRTRRTHRINVPPSIDHPCQSESEMASAGAESSA
ncbi:MAG TPA: DHA2 family efflux MFS transporter permease subunit [Actinomycetota bacterium]|nr:DHA2 family efflux MFS transporter permease subunit [Actinomycetota bacterium]